MPAEQSFGVLLRTARTDAGLTQEEVAERSGLSARAIGDLERGAVRRPQRKSVELLVTALGLGEQDAQALARAARRPLSLDTESGAQTEAAAGAAAEPAAVPRRLPSAVHHFTGREEQMATLRRWTETAIDAADSAHVLTIDGMAGIGKSALAVEFAHAVADRYPDGQLFLDLHGYTPGRVAVTPQDALVRMLRAVGADADSGVEDLDELAELWRSRAADRRLLIVLDNAADADHIRPLIPGRGGSLVLVTSRLRMPGLDAAAGLSLGVLPPEEAHALFTQVAGAQRVAAQDADVREAVGRCGRLPLAIRIAAARLRHRPSWRVSDLIDRMQESAAEAEGGEVAAAFEMSYRRLGPAEQRMFQALGAHPGSDIDVYAAAALAGLPRRRAAHLLEELLDHHLVEEHIPGRYTFHDLMREYARNKAAQARTADGSDVSADSGVADRDSAGSRDVAGDNNALLRLLDHYRYTASVAMNVLLPQASKRRPSIAAPATEAPVLAGEMSAVEWLESELPNLLACTAVAAARGWSTHVTQMSHIVWRFLLDGGRNRLGFELHGFAVGAARAAGDRESLINALRFYSMSCERLGRFPEAYAALEEARDLCDDDVALAAVVEYIGNISMATGRYERAAAEFEQALALWRSLGRIDGVGNDLGNLGVVYFWLGRYDESRENLLKALAIHDEHADPLARARSFVWLAVLAERTGDYAQACEYAERALDLAHLLSAPGIEADALEIRGSARLPLGLADESLADLERSWAIRRQTHEQAVTDSLLCLGNYQLRRGAYERAAGHYRQLLDMVESHDGLSMKTGALTGLGESLTALGHPDSALPHLRRAFDLAGSLGDPYRLARAREGLGRALHAVSELGTQLGVVGDSFDTSADAANLAAEAASHLCAAHEAFVRIGVPDAERLKSCLAQ